LLVRTVKLLPLAVRWEDAADSLYTSSGPHAHA
jgi:hypothetical protein